MHEFGIAQKILEIVRRELTSQEVNKVERIKVNISRILFIDDYSLKEAFDLVAKGTVAENAELEINQTDGRGEIKVEEIEARVGEV